MSPGGLGQPLRGVRVLDLTRLLPGPFATLLLGDMGADVVKVEDTRGGDYARYHQPFVGQLGAFFASINRNKRSIALDLKHPLGVELLHRLLPSADVLVESFRPGVLDRLGFGPDALLDKYQDLIVCSVTGFGQTGPARLEAGHDSGYLARSGALHGVGSASGEVVLPGIQVADIGGGALYAVSAVCAALVGRAGGNGGCHLDISITDGALSFMLPALTMISHGHEYQGPAAEMLNGGIACYSVYKTRDGRHMALGALEPKFWLAFCSAAGVDHLVSDRLEHRRPVVVRDDDGHLAGRRPLVRLHQVFHGELHRVAPGLGVVRVPGQGAAGEGGVRRRRVEVQELVRAGDLVVVGVGRLEGVDQAAALGHPQGGIGQHQGRSAVLVDDVHDDLRLVLQPVLRRDPEGERVVALVVHEMEQVHSLDVPLTVDAKVGRNWLEMEEVGRPDQAE